MLFGILGDDTIRAYNLPEKTRAGGLPAHTFLVDENIGAFKDRDENSEQCESPLLLFFTELS